MWNCPSSPDLICPGGCAAAGCTSEIIIEQVCVKFGEKYSNFGVSPLIGSWGMDWFEDQLEEYGPAVLTSVQQLEILKGAAHAIASMEIIPEASLAGEEFITAVKGKTKLI